MFSKRMMKYGNMKIKINLTDYKLSWNISLHVQGYQIINTLLDKFITAYNNQSEGKATSYDKLLLQILPEKHHLEKENLYDRLLHICHFISLLTDGNALLYYQNIVGFKH